jgi:2-oxoglutarate ferredoxin oxidoreductase subunit beta
MAFETNRDASAAGGNGKPAPKRLTRKDFTSDQDVRWCPGCGDYSILAQVQRVMPELGIAREKVVFVSGIGCSSRFPYYMNTYGFHTIHGRAPTIATGVRVANSDLTVFVVTGDGDALSIGGNHLIHVLRRNVNLKIMMFNNRIYGLTKGQYSPTSELGKKTKSTPMGSVDRPVNPLSLALAAEATLVARTIDTDTDHLQDMVRRIAAHEGSAFLEIYQNCNVFNDGAFDEVVERKVRAERCLYLEDGQPLRFGASLDKGIRLKQGEFAPEVVTVTNDDASGLLMHRETSEDPSHAFLLTRMDHPEFPVPMGVLRAVKRPVYEAMLWEQNRGARAAKGDGDLRKLFHQGDTWTVT